MTDKSTEWALMWAKVETRIAKEPSPLTGAEPSPADVQRRITEVAKFDRGFLHAMGISLAVAALAIGAVAQELPDEPPPAQHTYTKQLWIATGVNAATKVADLANTCGVLANGGHEDWIPTQTCAGVGARIAAGMAASVLVSWFLARHHHTKLAVALQYLSAGGNLAGIAYTEAHK